MLGKLPRLQTGVHCCLISFRHVTVWSVFNLHCILLKSPHKHSFFPGSCNGFESHCLADKFILEVNLFIQTLDNIVRRQYYQRCLFHWEMNLTTLSFQTPHSSCKSYFSVSRVRGCKPSSEEKNNNDSRIFFPSICPVSVKFFAAAFLMSQKFQLSDSNLLSIIPR